MNIKDKVKEYAEGKAINALTAAIEQAYAEGYNAGFNDGLASKEGEKPDDLDCSVKYVDLDLPSGTKWAADYLRDKNGNTIYLTYGEAAKLNIPTIEQYEELVNNCERKSFNSGRNLRGITLVGRNGNNVRYELNGRMIGYQYASFPSPRIGVWLKNENDDDSNQRKRSDIGANNANISPIIEFMGNKLPVILVQEK